MSRLRSLGEEVEQPPAKLPALRSVHINSLEAIMKRFAPILALTATLSIGVVAQTAALAQSSVQTLRDGNYRFCSNPPPRNRVNDLYLVNAGYCYVFRKTGNRLVGDYYDPKTLGEESVCVSGTLGNNIVSGEGREFIGSVGRQSTPPNSNGDRLVNWDNKGYLKVARAILVGKPGSVGTSVRYRRASLNLNGFYRYNAGTGQPPRDCFNR